MSDYFLEAKNISKAYQGVQALDGVTMHIAPGEIHCLVGENGSGKSTLIKTIGGVVVPDSGELVINGRQFERLQAIDSIREGVQIIYQDLSLFPNLTVAENISLNQMVEQKNKVVNWTQMHRIAEHGLAEIDEKLDLNEHVENIAVAKKQIVAISRALTQNAKLIIMDEPTSAITKEEVDHLFSVIMRLKAKGIATLFVSHKLNEVFEIAENVTVLRDGQKVGDYPTTDLDDRKLTFLMTGQNLEHKPYTPPETEARDIPYLEVKDLTKAGQFEDVSFQIRPGDILGITGLIGSGRTEVALSLFGLNQPDSGKILVNGKPVRIGSPEDAKKYGIGYLPEDRLSQGLFTEQSIGDNIIITIVKELLGKIGLIRGDEREKTQDRWVSDLKIKTPTAKAPASSLSGGNQQRVVIAKWLATEPKVFILDGPTIGIDIASKSNIHDIIRGLAGEGMAIIMISDEIAEILQNCNRILVMRRGRVVKDIEDATDVSEDELFNIVSGIDPNEGR